jgi:DNA-binding NarL/FixJ family response regulator
MIRVFLLNDHEVVRRGIRDLLEAAWDIEVVGETGLALDAAHRAPALRPNVAILDARLPVGSGIDAARDIRSVDPTIHVLILTSCEDDDALFDQPADRGAEVLGREDRQELCLQPAGQARPGTTYAGRSHGHEAARSPLIMG